MNKDESIRFATKYLEDLLSFFGVNVAIDSTIDDEVIQLSIPSTSMNSLLIGKEANNLRALQHVVSMALASRDAEVTRVSVDVADYKRQRADRIAEQAEEWIREVRVTGQTKVLKLNATDRSFVHKVDKYYYDIFNESEGEGSESQIFITKKYILFILPLGHLLYKYRDIGYSRLFPSWHLSPHLLPPRSQFLAQDY